MFVIQIDEGDFQNVMASFFLVRKYSCSLHIFTFHINFHEDLIGRFYVKLLTAKQTDKQTNRRTTGKIIITSFAKPLKLSKH